MISEECAHGCMCHVNPRDFVPVCPLHNLPLHAAEAGRAECPWRGAKRRHIGGEGFTRNRCHTYPPEAWGWARRDTFNQADLPPYNGFQAPNVDRHGGPRWNVNTSGLCLDCGVQTPHAFGENRAVCLACGVVTWQLDPAYTA